MEENRVKLDGDAIRNIREEKKLTQLYVAKVVGVTTDTVSRWENNRYPSVRRENAEQLAEALEVSVSAVLRSEEVAEQLPEPAGRHRRWWVAGIGAALLLLVIYLFWPSAPLHSAVTVERLLPVYAASQTIIPVRLHLHIEPGVDGLVLRENFPAGWQLVEGAPPPSSLDNIDGTARWIIQQIEPEMRISYLLRVGPKPAAGQALFGGEIVASQQGSNQTFVVAGTDQLEVAPFHWADHNGDLVIDDSEALEASVASVEMKQTHLDWNTVERIWDAGSYRFDSEKGTFLPQTNRSGH